MGLALSKNEEYAQQALDFLPTASYRAALKVYEAMMADPNLDDRAVAEIGKHDRYFLLVGILQRHDMYHPWIYERCREVEANPDGYLDLWGRGHFKCIHEDSLVFMADGTEKPIKTVDVGDLVMGYNDNWQSVPVPVLAKSIEPDTPCLEITLRSGRQILASTKHHFLTIHGWRKSRNLNVGDFLGVPHEINTNKADNLPSEEASFLAYMCAEGTCANGKCSFTNTDDELVVDFANINEKLGFDLNQNNGKDKNTYHLSNQDGPKRHGGPRHLIKFHGLDSLSINKRIPSAVLGSSINSQREFISIFWACDGGIGMHAGNATCRLGSLWLCYDLQNLLHQSGIFSSLHSYDNGHAGQHVLAVNGKRNLEKLAEIGIRLSRKQDQLLSTIPETIGQSDPIPTGWERLLTRPSRARKFRNLGVSHARGKYTNRAKVRRFAEIDENEELMRLCDSDVGWDPIVEIKDVGNLPCVDIQVGGHQAFIANHIVSHNSSLITQGGCFQEIINDPEITICILSQNRSTSKSFLRQIKQCCEQNALLNRYYPDIFWQDPRKESPSWSEDFGILVKRKGSQRERTVEAFGLVDSQPTGRHYALIIYNDVVTEDSVGTPEMMKKTTSAWELSLNLKTTETEGAPRPREWYEGTRYHFSDTYREIMARGAAIPRIYPATDNGQVDGNPVLLTKKSLIEKRRSQGPYTFSCQLLLNPLADEVQNFKMEWLKYWDAMNFRNLTIGIVCDPAGEKKKESDYTVFVVYGIGADQNTYVITWIRDRMNLTERASTLFALHRHYRPLKVGYEKYGKDSDIEHYEDKMKRENYRFTIISLGGPVGQLDRIRRLVPDFEQGRIYVPETSIRSNYEDQEQDLTQIFIDEEYRPFPVCVHNDMLDALSRTKDKQMELAIPSVPVQTQRPRTAAGWT